MNFTDAHHARAQCTPIHSRPSRRLRGLSPSRRLLLQVGAMSACGSISARAIVTTELISEATRLQGLGKVRATGWLGLGFGFGFGFGLGLGSYFGTFLAHWRWLANPGPSLTLTLTLTLPLTLTLTLTLAPSLSLILSPNPGRRCRAGPRTHLLTPGRRGGQRRRVVPGVRVRVMVRVS